MIICMSSFLPQTSVFKFKRDGNHILKLSDADIEKIEDTFDKLTDDDKKYIGYQLPCKGDSGAGHWMHDSREKRKGIVAITSHTKPSAGKVKFCGAPVHSLLTTHPTILGWI